MDSFFLQFANDGQQQPTSAVRRFQGCNSLHNGLLSITELGKWYRVEYSYYATSTIHVLGHKISDADPREIPLQTRVKDGLLQVG
jgi:hypothetical protein